MKAILITALFLFSQVFAQSNTTQLQEADREFLFIYYDFDSADLANKTVKDLSGNGHNGMIVGNVTLDAGKFGTAMTFHNNVGGDQLVNAGKIDITKDTLTISAWVTVLPAYSNMSVNMKIVSKKNTWDEMAGFELQYNPAEKIITFLSSGQNTGNATNVTLDSNWHHVAAVANAFTVQIYVDGVEVTTDNDINKLVPNPGKDMLIGSSSLVAPAGGAWVGAIDEFRIYSVALQKSQINWLMTGSDIGSYNQTQASPSKIPPVPSSSVNPSPVPSTVPTTVPTASPTSLPSPIVIPVEQESSDASSTAMASFLVVISVFFCIFMM